MDPSIVNLKGNLVFLLVSRNQLSFVATFVFHRDILHDEPSDKNTRTLLFLSNDVISQRQTVNF